MVDWSLLQRVGAAAFDRVQTISVQTLLSAGSTFSVLSLVSALLVATTFIAAMRLRRRGRVRWRLLRKALWPRRSVLGPSGKADLGFFLFNTFSAGGLISWGLLTQAQVGDWTIKTLNSAFGPVAPHGQGVLSATVMTVTVYLASELAYWLDHWLSHNVPCLWEIHKVHHTAEGLTPFTNFRVHPLETLKFYNLVALFSGGAYGLVSHLFGFRPSHIQVFQTDVLFFSFMFTIVHLQHSHVWISFRGVLGRLIMSPAHHQVHHATDPRLFGRNLGATLALWDLLFGTLYIPAAQRERLTYGVEGEGHDVHSVTGTLITPMIRAVDVLLRSKSRAAAPSQVDAPSRVGASSI
jgi:sterol desaturase/sphingolipid hydroxylase (fatty acid hydroxylase superfamily)